MCGNHCMSDLFTDQKPQVSRTERDPDVEQYFTIVCDGCNKKIGVYLRHWEKARCSCGAMYWALRPKGRYPAPMKLFPWPGDYLTSRQALNRWETTLDEADLRRAKQEASENNEDTRRQGYKDKFDPASWGSSRLENDTNSRAAEIAASKVTGLPLNPYHGQGRGPDLGTDVQIKHTHWRTGKMIIRPKQENPDHKFILVIRQGNTFTLVGWLWGKEAHIDRHLKPPHSPGEPQNWEIEQIHLRQMDTLPL